MLKSILPRRIQRWLIPFISLLGLHSFHQGISQDPLRISKQQFARIDASIEQAVEDFNLPSLSVAIVHQGKLVHVKSAGVLEAGLSDLADEKSKYAVASNTKAFTSAALAKLVDQKLISWKDPVTKFLPEFKLYDPYVTSELTIEDLLCHRSGLATFSGDLLWYGTTWSSEEVLQRAQYLEPTSGFRTEFGYQNILYIAAGAVIEKVSGMPWKTFIQDSLLVPMGMNDAVLSTHDLQGLKNVAQPHNELEDESLVPIDWVNWDNMAPAGALIASVADMSHWMIVQMDSGRTNSEQLWNPQQTNKMWTLHTPIPVSTFYSEHLPSMHFRGYGLGWELGTLHGKKIVGHSGGYDGMISRQMLVPEEKLGIFIATNTNSSVPWALGYDALGILLENSKETPLLEMMKNRRSGEQAQREKENEELNASRILNTKPSHALPDYTGWYTDKMYGDLKIEQSNEGNLVFEFLPTPLFHGHLEHWHYDTFRLHWDEQMMLPSGMAHFSIDVKGNVQSLDIDVPNPDFDFTELHFVKQ